MQSLNKILKLLPTKNNTLRKFSEGEPVLPILKPNAIDLTEYKEKMKTVNTQTQWSIGVMGNIDWHDVVVAAMRKHVLINFNADKLAVKNLLINHFGKKHMSAIQAGALDPVEIHLYVEALPLHEAINAMAKELGIPVLVGNANIHETGCLAKADLTLSEICLCAQELQNNVQQNSTMELN